MRISIPYHFEATVPHGRSRRTNAYQGRVEDVAPTWDADEAPLVLLFEGFVRRRGDAPGAARPQVGLRSWRGVAMESLLGPCPDGTMAPVTADASGLDLSLHCADVPAVGRWHRAMADGRRMFDGSGVPRCFAGDDAREAARRAASRFAFVDGVAHRTSHQPVIRLGGDGLTVGTYPDGTHNFRADEADLALEVLAVRNPEHLGAAREAVARIDVVAPHLLTGSYHDGDLRRAGRDFASRVADGLRDRSRAVVLAHADLRDAVVADDPGRIREALGGLADALPGSEAAQVIALHLDVHARRAARLDPTECPSLATVSL